MADVYVKTVAGGSASPAKCREFRRRNVELRLLAAGTDPDPPPPTRGEKRKEPLPSSSESVPGSEKRTRPPVSAPSPVPASPEKTPGVASTSQPAAEQAGDLPVEFGSVSLSGRSREMEDAVSVRPGFFQSSGGVPLHFFAVFDGHGGSHVSALCRDRMHLMLAEELAAVAEGEEATAAVENEEQRWQAAVRRCFARMDELAMAACACGIIAPPPCGCGRAPGAVVGSTAAAALIDGKRILVANCGDSRAVLCRAGRAIPLSSDHKPDRPDELARIEAAGGRVIYNNGARVNGILAMSRAVGDRFLKPIVISEPEIMVVERDPEDECLIIASDGLWDVVSNELACDVTRRSLEEGDPSPTTEEGSGAGESTSTASGEEYPSDDRCSFAAALLARLALGRKTPDNISVIVVDLRGR